SVHAPAYKGEDWGDCLSRVLDWLGGVLLEPIDRKLRSSGLFEGAPVIVVAPAHLGVLPLQAARVGKDGRRFCDTWTVSYSPNARALQRNQRRRRDRANAQPNLQIIADPGLTYGLPEVQ